MKSLVTLISVILIIYFSIQAGGKFLSSVNIDDLSNSELELKGNVIERSLSKIFINLLKSPEGHKLFERMLKPDSIEKIGKNVIFDLTSINLVESLFHTVDSDRDTNKIQAFCGDIVDVDYVIADINKEKVIKERKVIKLGEDPAEKALSSIIVGMHEGQTRKAVIPYDFDNKEVKLSLDAHAEVTLHKVERTNLDICKNVRKFDKIIHYQSPYLCGEEVNFNLRILSLNGDLLFENKISEPISYRVGDNNYPIIFAYGLFNKSKAGERIIISPGKYFNSFKGKKWEKFDYKIDEFYILELS